MRKFLLTISFVTAIYSWAQVTFIEENFADSVLSSDWTNNSIEGSSSWELKEPGWGSDLGDDNYLFIVGQGNSDTSLTRFESPSFDATGEEKVFFSFIHAFDGFYDVGYVEVYDGSEWVRIDSFVDETGELGNGEKELYDVSEYINAAMQVGFTFSTSNAYTFNDWAIDQVMVFNPGDAEIGIDSIGLKAIYGLTDAESITIRVNNNGLEEVTSFNAGFTFGSTVVSETVNETISVGSSFIYKFDATVDLSAQDTTYEISTYVTLDGDANATNDTLATEFHNHSAVFPYVETFTEYTWYEGWNLNDQSVFASESYGDNGKGIALSVSSYGDYDRIAIYSKLIGAIETGTKLEVSVFGTNFSDNFEWTSGDAFNVSVSTDYGANYTLVATVDSSNAEADGFTSIEASLESYVGEEIVVKLEAVSDMDTYMSLYIDDFYVNNGQDVDTGEDDTDTDIGDDTTDTGDDTDTGDYNTGDDTTDTGDDNTGDDTTDTGDDNTGDDSTDDEDQGVVSTVLEEEDLDDYTLFGRDGLYKVISKKQLNTVRIYTLSGQKLDQYEVQDYIVHVDLRTKQNGVYIIGVNNKFWKILK